MRRTQFVERGQMLDVVGEVSLLVGGLAMIRTGVSKALGGRLRYWVAVSTRNRFVAFAVGTIATLALQSSTAMALIVASFAAASFTSSAMAQAIMLGANVGTSLAVPVIAFGFHSLWHVFIAAAVILCSFAGRERHRHFGSALLGLGLMLLSLQLLGQSSDPLIHSQPFRALMTTLVAAPMLAVIIAAILAVAFSSSIAVVMLVMSLASSGLIGRELIMALVLGANLGGAIPPILATARHGPLARRVTVGNLMVRLIGCFVLLPFMDQVVSALAKVDLAPDRFAVGCHVVLNVLLAAGMLPLLGPVTAVMGRMFPEGETSSDSASHLDMGHLENPSMALADATRETLRIGDRVLSMLNKGFEALMMDDVKRCVELAAMDDDVDQLSQAVKLYLAQLQRSTLAEKEEKRAAQIILYAINLEHIGDIVDKNLRHLVEKKISQQLSFSVEGASEIEQIYAITVENLRLAQSILLSGDERLARRLVESKLDIRRLEERSAENHLERLRDGKVLSVQTSAVHLDVLRDLKRVNAHAAAIAYPLLRELGALRESRLIAAEVSHAHAKNC